MTDRRPTPPALRCAHCGRPLLVVQGLDRCCNVDCPGSGER